MNCEVDAELLVILIEQNYISPAQYYNYFHKKGLERTQMHSRGGI